MCWIENMMKMEGSHCKYKKMFKKGSASNRIGKVERIVSG